MERAAWILMDDAVAARGASMTFPEAMELLRRQGSIKAAFRTWLGRLDSRARAAANAEKTFIVILARSKAEAARILAEAIDQEALAIAQEAIAIPPPPSPSVGRTVSSVVYDDAVEGFLKPGSTASQVVRNSPGRALTLVFNLFQRGLIAH
jgi:hypothetical protein